MFTILLSEPPAHLSFDCVTLLFSKLDAGDEAPGLAPSYHFRILADGADAGHLNLRTGGTEHVCRCAGHVGFEISPRFRGGRYALYACRALAPFARSVAPSLFITCDPDNHAARRTIELLGATFMDEIPVPEHDPQRERGSQSKLRYRWEP